MEGRRWAVGRGCDPEAGEQSAVAGQRWQTHNEPSSLGVLPFQPRLPTLGRLPLCSLSLCSPGLLPFGLCGDPGPSAARTGQGCGLHGQLSLRNWQTQGVPPDDATELTHRNASHLGWFFKQVLLAP